MGRQRLNWSKWFKDLLRRSRGGPAQPSSPPGPWPTVAETDAGETLWRVRFMANHRILEEHFFLTYAAAVSWLGDTVQADWNQRPLVVLIGPADQVPLIYHPEPEESA